MSALLVLTTISSKKEALKLAQLLLSKRLAACVNISSPMHSLYWWKKKKEKSKEFQLWIKTKAAVYSKLEAALKKYHPYELPEILAFPIQKGSRNYLNWLSQEVD